MGKLDTVFSNDTLAYVNTRAVMLPCCERQEFRAEARRELWDFMPFDLVEIRQTVNRVYRKYTPV
jgi:hypothetical protein